MKFVGELDKGQLELSSILEHLSKLEWFNITGGPPLVKAATGEEISAEELGGRKSDQIFATIFCTNPTKSGVKITKSSGQI